MTSRRQRMTIPRQLGTSRRQLITSRRQLLTSQRQLTTSQRQLKINQCQLKASQRQLIPSRRLIVSQLVALAMDHIPYHTDGTNNKITQPLGRISETIFSKSSGEHTAKNAGLERSLHRRLRGAVP